MRRLKTLASALVVALVVVAALDYAASAATGRPFILGKINKAKRQTALVRTTSGPALKLTTRSADNPPLVVNGKGKVANLNADTLDGIDSSALMTVPIVITKRITSPVSAFEIIAPVPPGSYLVSYSAYLAASPVVDLGYIQCFVTQANGADTTWLAESTYDTAGAQFTATSGSGLATKLSSAGTIRLTCHAGVPFVTGNGASQPVQFVLTRVDGVSASTARLAPGSARVSK